jgi:hypothetical protein
LLPIGVFQMLALEKGHVMGSRVCAMATTAQQARMAAHANEDA